MAELLLRTQIYRYQRRGEIKGARGGWAWAAEEERLPWLHHQEDQLLNEVGLNNKWCKWNVNSQCLVELSNGFHTVAYQTDIARIRL